MEPNYQSDILRRLRELNALIVSHIEKAKKDVQQLEITLHEKNRIIASLPGPETASLRQLVSQWQEHLN